MSLSTVQALILEHCLFQMEMKCLSSGSGCVRLCQQVCQFPTMTRFLSFPDEMEFVPYDDSDNDEDVYDEDGAHCDF